MLTCIITAEFGDLTLVHLIAFEGEVLSVESSSELTASSCHVYRSGRTDHSLSMMTEGSVEENRHASSSLGEAIKGNTVDRERPS